MEDVLDVYERPYDPLCPVVCLDETNRQLIEQRSLPMEPGQPERVDYEYRRHGVVDLFVAFEPLACKRQTGCEGYRKPYCGGFCSFSAGTGGSSLQSLRKDRTGYGQSEYSQYRIAVQSV